MRFRFQFRRIHVAVDTFLIRIFCLELASAGLEKGEAVLWGFASFSIGDVVLSFPAAFALAFAL